MPAWLRSLFGQRVENPFVDLEVAWGGYYACRDEESGPIRVLRLIDLTKAAYHASLFQEKFAEVPTLAEVKGLVPFIQHVPMDSRQLVSSPMRLIGGEPLTAADLGGYMYFLEEHGVSTEDRAALETRLIGFSHESPLRLKIAVVDNQLQVAERS